MIRGLRTLDAASGQALAIGRAVIRGLRTLDAASGQALAIGRVLDRERSSTPLGAWSCCARADA